MIVGVPKEIKDNEKRVSLTPSGARDLIRSGTKVILKKMLVWEVVFLTNFI